MLGALLGMSWGDGLRLVHLALSVCAIIQAGGEGWQVMLALVVNLLCAWTRFMRCGVYARLGRLFDEDENKNDNIKNYSGMETKTTMDAEMMKGLFGGANFNGEVQIVVAPREKVVFKEVQMKGEERHTSSSSAAMESMSEELGDRQILFNTHEEQRLWAERFVSFLRLHKMMDENGLTKDKDSFINRALACFMGEWEKRGLLREKYISKAPSLFLYHSCGIRGIDPKTHGNACAGIMKECLLMERNSPLQYEVICAIETIG